MAVLKITESILAIEPTLISILEEYFDKIQYLNDEHPEIKVYTVEKEGLPSDKTQVECIMKRRRDGSFYVLSCEVIDKS